MNQRWTSLGALAGALTVILGAFGAHALEGRLDAEQTGWWETGVLYLAIHSLALVGYGSFRQVRPSNRPGLPGWGFVLGILLFVGTLHAMALGGPKWLGAITPIGGTAWIVAWLAFAFEARRAPATSTAASPAAGRGDVSN